jgi:[glutamine synthetase] adenylyltransferase / [glutamine synthetase]-adenylyl-L-tyrosine phosphorylase
MLLSCEQTARKRCPTAASAKVPTPFVGAESVSPIPSELDAARARVALALSTAGATASDETIEIGARLLCAYPAFGPHVDAHPGDLVSIGPGLDAARDARMYRLLAAAAIAEAGSVGAGLRRWAAREKLRIAARELFSKPGRDVDVTARELSDLADVCCETALSEALQWADARFGVPVAETAPAVDARAAGRRRCPFVVIGMGKLGGRELNAGSDIDLLLFYETDDGRVELPDDGPSSSARPGQSLHEYFTRVAQRFVATLDEPTEDGTVWRVDLRLRPEGTRGPLVNALGAAERYYETWGRTWERAALLRARPIAGDVGFGARVLEALAPFVWRRAVDPRLADEMFALLMRGRAEVGADVVDDLKLGPGGIREVEFFAQSLQLVWGGAEPRVRATNTIEALRRLRARGYVTEGEERDLSDAYLWLRRAEHRVQFATGLQTHSVPRDPVVLDRLARSLGYAGETAFARDLGSVRTTVSRRFGSLRESGARLEDPAYGRLWASLDADDEPAVGAAAAEFFPFASGDLARHLLALSRPPHSPLGAATRDDLPEFARRLVGALADAADPEQAARLLAAFFARFATPGAYVRALADDPPLVRALCTLLGASSFLGESLVGHPELVDRVLESRDAPGPDVARAQVEEEVAALDADEAVDVDAFVGGLRRAKRRVTFETGLADLAGDIDTSEAGYALSALADATLDRACEFAMGERRRAGHTVAGGLAVIAMGKLGGREIGYGSDLDLFFVHDAPDGADEEELVRVAQRVLRLVSTPHDEGRGYDLDTRLRPSGNQGLLIVSADGFARYQENRSEAWERQALVKARACAGDRELGERVIAVARKAAYDRGAPDPEALHRLRVRMEREIGGEHLDRSPSRYDLKVGRGGIVDVEFATQWLQMRHGEDLRVRTTETGAALAALASCGYLDTAVAAAFRDGWRFLRRLEQRVRISQETSVSLLEEGAPGLATLARRVGLRDAPGLPADRALLEVYEAVTRDVRAAYLAVLGLT